jgi:hypothetical protein
MKSIRNLIILFLSLSLGANLCSSKKYVKVEAFNDVEQLRNTLSQNGIGELRQWHKEEPECWSSSDYFPFGSESSVNGMQNNLAYYLESLSVKYVQQVKLMLNINNKSEQVKALAMYSDAVEKTFKSIGLEPPKGLLEACKSGKEFKSEQSQFLVTSDLSRGKIDAWKLTIQSK